jgi:signal transduction histidine kinase/CHASE2 domain-containing sensor protein
LWWTAYFIQLDLIAYDFTLRLAGPVTPESPTVIVAIDDDSLGRVEAWPWSRDKIAKIVNRIEQDEPRAIALDILLDEATTEEADAALAESISNSKGIVLATRIEGTARRARWNPPNEKLVQSNALLGHVHADPDLDGISRQIVPIKNAQGTGFPAFAIQALKAAHLDIKGSFVETKGATQIFRSTPVRIRFAGGNQTFEHVPAADVLEDMTEPGRFKDKIVLIGATAAGLQDQWFTPFTDAGQRMAGVEIHANAIETLYAGSEIHEIPQLSLLGLLTFSVFALWWLDRRFEGRRFFALAVLLVPSLVVVSYMAMKYFNVWIPFEQFWTAIVVVVPGLEVKNRLRVNRNLDEKIERLSKLGTDVASAPAEWNARGRILDGLPEGPARQGWLERIDAHQRETVRRKKIRLSLFGAPRPSYRWRLNALDFFNEELVRFLSFNTAILASIDDVIIVSDPAGRIVYQNPAARRLAGFSESPGFAPDYFASLLDGRAFAPAFASVLTTGQPVNMEFVPGRGGKSYHHATLSPIERIGIVLSLHDATAQHELNQAKNDMVSLVSHELRTPLTSIRGYSDMLVKYDLVQEKGKQFLGTIVDESIRLNELIQSFLDIAYIESGRQKLSLSEFTVAPVLRDMMTVLGPVAAGKQISLEVAEAADLSLRADRLLLYQALTNLVTNAIKYSRSGTNIRLTVSNGDGRVHFDVADQGCGIPAEDRMKIFEKFYRRGNEETLNQSGFGLGLAFVKEVAARHGGDVYVESEVGKGSTFTLWIPNQ